MNLHSYVGSDPVNWVDPTRLFGEIPYTNRSDNFQGDIVVTGTRGNGVTCRGCTTISGEAARWAFRHASGSSRPGTVIFYTMKAHSFSYTAGGLGTAEFEFEVVDPTGTYKYEFNGTLFTINYGLGGDLSTVVFSGALEGDFMPITKTSLMEALNKQVVAGSAFTLAFGNGIAIGSSLSIGNFSDPDSTVPIDGGISFGWEGFRGTLYIDEGSFVRSNTGVNW